MWDGMAWGGRETKIAKLRPQVGRLVSYSNPLCDVRTLRGFYDVPQMANPAPPGDRSDSTVGLSYAYGRPYSADVILHPNLLSGKEEC